MFYHCQEDSVTVLGLGGVDGRQIMEYTNIIYIIGVEGR